LGTILATRGGPPAVGASSAELGTAKGLPVGTAPLRAGISLLLPKGSGDQGSGGRGVSLRLPCRRRLGGSSPPQLLSHPPRFRAAAGLACPLTRCIQCRPGRRAKPFQQHAR